MGKDHNGIGLGTGRSLCLAHFMEAGHPEEKELDVGRGVCCNHLTVKYLSKSKEVGMM